MYRDFEQKVQRSLGLLVPSRATKKGEILGHIDPQARTISVGPLC